MRAAPLYFSAKREDVIMVTRMAQHVIDSLPVLIAYVDNDEKYRFINNEYKNWLGLDEENIIGKKLCDVLGNDRYLKIKEHVQMALLGKKTNYEVSMPENKIFSARYIPFVDGNGKVDGFSVLVEDITKDKLLVLEKDNLLIKLQRALDDIKSLKGIIPICSYCHSIRNEEGAWDQLEAYITNHSEAAFSHGVCPKCIEKARSEAGLK